MPELPTGTVTFLFTDIEGSTRLWEEHPEAMDRALARHNAIVEEAVGPHNGHVFKTGGDAFCCAFANARDALNAALTAQQMLHSEPWDGDVELRVRMAVHTGPAQEREGDYFGASVNRVARLLACAHGGQTLLSRVTYELVREHAAEGVSFQDLGEHSLRDLSHPEHVFQLCHPDLPGDFPPLRSLQAFPHNLPLQLTSFIGREQEIEDVKQLLRDTRLLTLTGVGGAGKTRLALQVAADVVEDHKDGVWLTELASLADPDLVAQTVASALGVREQPGRPIVDTLTNHLRRKSCLLILDNCEHLLDACARLADELLRSCPELKILASSREGLGIAGETTYHVLSLSVPEAVEQLTAEGAVPYEAVRLFLDRAQSHQPSFEIRDVNAGAITQVCRRLDGIPLAIELAAARVRAMPVEQIAGRLDDRFRLLTGGSRTALPRQQTLQALIDWSYDLLSDQEKILFRRLSVFAGSWTLEAAEAVCAGDGIDDWEVLDLLASLVDKSVAVYEEAEARYRLLETVRQYARDRLLESGEGVAVRGRHRDFYLALVTDPGAKAEGLSQARWFERLEIEHDNLRGALDWCEDAPDGAEAGLRLAIALMPFWHARGPLSEGRQRLAAAAARAGDAAPGARATALRDAGRMAMWLLDHQAARALHEESVRILRKLDDSRGLVDSLNAWAHAAWAEEDYSAARRLSQESLAISREVGYPSGVGPALEMLGLAASDEGNHAAALSFLQESVLVRRKLGNKSPVAHSLSNLGIVAWRQGNYTEARALQEESLAIRRDLGQGTTIVMCLERLGAISQAEGAPDAAARLLGAAQALREPIGFEGARRLRDEHESTVAAVREALGDEPLEAAWAEGRAMTMEEAIEYALGEEPPEAEQDKCPSEAEGS